MLREVEEHDVAREAVPTLAVRRRPDEVRDAHPGEQIVHLAGPGESTVADAELPSPPVVDGLLAEAEVEVVVVEEDAGPLGQALAGGPAGEHVQAALVVLLVARRQEIITEAFTGEPIIACPGMK